MSIKMEKKYTNKTEKPNVNINPKKVKIEDDLKDTQKVFKLETSFSLDFKYIKLLPNLNLIFKDGLVVEISFLFLNIKFSKVK